MPIMERFRLYLGDCKAVDNFLFEKPHLSWRWGIAHFFNVLFRSVAQVVFVNNPISGLLILGACFIPDWRVGLATFLAVSIATLSEMVILHFYSKSGHKQNPLPIL